MEYKTSHVYHVSYAVLLFCLYLLNTTVRTVWESSFFYGEISVYVTFSVAYFLFLKTYLNVDRLPRAYISFYIVVFIWLLYISASFIYTDYVGVDVYAQLYLHVLFIACLVTIPFHPKYIKMAGMIFSVVTVVFFLHWLFSGLPFHSFKSVFRNENYLAVLLFCLLYFQVIAIHYSKRMQASLLQLGVVLNLVLIVSTGARSVVLAIFVIFLTALCYKFFPRLLKGLFYIVMASSLSFVGVYVGLSKTDLGDKINTLSREWTSKNFFSGRHGIWSQVIEKMADHPFLGYGLGVRASDVADTPLTAHNMYLQVMLEFGIFGFILFFLILAFIWHLLLKNDASFVTRCSVAFMLDIITYNTFELTMLQNNYSIAIFQWTIMTAGIGVIQMEKKHVTRRTSRSKQHL